MNIASSFDKMERAIQQLISVVQIKYDPSQPRDEQGRFGSGGGSGSGRKVEAFDPKSLPSVARKSGTAVKERCEADPELAGAVSAYTMLSHGPLNSKLRAGRELDAGEQKMADKLTELTEMNLAEPLSVYRGVGGRTGDEFLSKARTAMDEGGTLTDNGFSSTSLNAAKATRFTTSKVLLQIETNKGAFIDPVSGSKGEQEFLMSCGTKYSVQGIDDNVSIVGTTIGGKRTVLRRTVIRLKAS